MLPTRPSVTSVFSPWPPRFMTRSASTPARTPTRTHVANMTKLMTLSPSQGDVRQAGVGDRVLQVVRGLGLGRGDADPRSRRQLGEGVEGFQMRLGEQRDHRDAPAVQEPLHLGEMAEARDGHPPAAGARGPPGNLR